MLMPTINEKFLKILQNDDFHPGMLSVDSEHRDILATVTVQDIETLIARLQEVKPLIEHYHTERHKAALKLLQDVVAASGQFCTVEELLMSVSGSVPTVKAEAVPQSGNHVFEVVLYDSVKNEHRTYRVVNTRMPLALTNDPVYRTIINKDKSMMEIENFLRAYSEDYRKLYPINAKWDGQEFHMNERGVLNKTAQKYFKQYMKKNPHGTTKQFREQSLLAYKQV
ncbi:hypothetical protein RPZ55_001927 [Salmonella enterica]|uniref:hypothetical protein n=1 Tax=Citrobacter freundii TaxID=546 RepID=UPI000F9AA253|nr:hypothetical protein [Salmonella enterica subsp. enterica serovar Schwarzengrund]EBI3245374.1 hypothetical protein [Salmonella enterica]EDU3946563.1 hypothetical protein [Salmonella enterica subsp. enterica serovar 4,[5],12:b:-]HCL1431440.1 hypothetical protein [Salmonella enterica subsp. enterica serovar Agona]HCL1499262.1 hypothetical protein [Salmonella enterica subsp. enterica serovar Derby]HEA5031568.1 hypothetical protein [Salmonella enterica subsp. enterica serovar Typhimurium]